MFEKVNKYHPDKVADRIAGAIVDLAYNKVICPKIAVEVLVGHHNAMIIVESSVKIRKSEVLPILWRIAGIQQLKYVFTSQDIHLADNQAGKFRCGDNGIFKGMPITKEQQSLTQLAKMITKDYPSDGKYILDEENKKLIICQSYATTKALRESYPNATINPLGDWTGGLDVDSGATNRKLGSDMGDAVTGGGLHGKDLSKADVSINIYAHLKAQAIGQPVELSCAIGDEFVDGKPFGEIVLIAKEYVNSLGGFEKLAEWGLIR